MSVRLSSEFFQRDAVTVAPDLLGKTLVRKYTNGIELRDIIAETEAYQGEEDLACHASGGRTKRNEIMYSDGGVVYVYLIYGMYWMLNIITGKINEPQGVLIRSLKNTEGPGRVGRQLELDKSFYGENLVKSYRLWIEDCQQIESSEGGNETKYITAPRVGVEYAGVWADKPWRFILGQNER